MGAVYFSKNKAIIREGLLKHGAVWLRGFDLMKGVAGHREMYEALEMEPCLDPLHSSGLRKFASERDALYEEVSFFSGCCRTTFFQQSPLLTMIDLLQRSISLLSEDIILVCMRNLPQSERQRMLRSFASRRPPKQVVASWLPTALPSLPRLTPRFFKSYMTAKFEFLLAILTFPPAFLDSLRRVSKEPSMPL